VDALNTEVHEDPTEGATSFYSGPTPPYHKGKTETVKLGDHTYIWD